MPQSALFGLAFVALAVMGPVSDAAAEVVPLSALETGAGQAEPDSARDPALPEDFTGLLAVEVADVGHAPLLELLGMPAQPSRAKTVWRSGPFEAVTASSGHETGRLVATAAQEEPDEGESFARRAMGVFEGLGLVGGTSDAGVMRPGAVAELSPPPPGRSSEARSSWLRDALTLLRSNREWVLAAVAAIVFGMIAMRASALWASGRPRSGSRASTRVAAVPSRAASR